MGSLSWAQNFELSTIEIEGNSRTKDFVIQRELVLDLNATYSTLELDSLMKISENRIRNLNLFNSVKFSPSYNEDSVSIEISVIEKWYIWPIPFVEFSDRNFNVWQSLEFNPDRTNYGLYLFNYNLFGRNHTLKASLITGYNKTVAMEYRVPFLSQKSNWGISSKIKQTSQSEIWLNTLNDALQFYENGSSDLIKQTSAYVQLTNRFKPYRTVVINGSYQKTKLDRSIFDIATDYLNGDSEMSVYQLSTSIKTDSRDNIYLPTKGTYSEPKFTVQYFDMNNSFSNVALSLKTQLFNQISPKFYTAFSMYGETNFAEKLPYEYTRRLGYQHSIRGFETYVIDGHRSMLVNAAVRYHLINKPNIPLHFIPLKNYNFLPINMYLEMFIDGGVVDHPNATSTNTLSNKGLYSTGISVQTLFYNDRVLRLEFSLNSLNEGGFFVHFKKAI